MKDQISALMDDEISLQEAEYLYTALKAEGESRECWMTYHLIGDAMRGSPTFKHDLRQRIMQQIDTDPIIFIPKNAEPALEPATRKPSRLWSVAASVAAVMFVGMIVLQQQPQQAEDILPMEIAQNLPAEYLQAHQSVVPSSAAYYIQSAAYTAYTERAK